MKRLLLPLLGFALVAAAPAKSSAPKERKWSADAFECVLPSAWYAEARPDGVSARSPEDDGGVASVITIRYMSPDGPEKTIDSYLARQTAKPAVEVHGWSIGTPEPALVAGRASRRLVNATSEFTPPSGAPPREVPMREEHVLVPAAKGFYLLLFYAPRSQYAKQKRAFDRALAAFHPKL